MSRSSLKAVRKLIDMANNNLSVEQSFLMELKKSIEMTDESYHHKPSQTYKPSSMNCIRGMYYQIMGVEPDESPSSYCMVGICNSGTDIHIRMQTYIDEMQKNGFDCEYVDVAEFVKSRNLDYLDVVSKSGIETKLYHKKLNMSFMCDGILRYKSHYYILEIKTEASFKWNHRSAVDPKHYNQGTAYSIAFNLPEVLFIYVNRDVLDLKAYMLNVTDEMKQELIGTIELCDECVKKQKCPDKPDDLPKRTCEYCGYRTICNQEV